MTKTHETGQDTDVFGVWRQLYDANEKAWSAALAQAMETPEFGESSGKLLETMLAAQKSVRDNMRAYLETMNVPTREDIARLGELVVGIEEKIDQIADRLDALDGSFRSRSAEPGKIDRIADRLGTIDRSLRTRSAEAAKIDRIAKRLDTIDRSLRTRSAEAAKPAVRAARTAATKPATAAATASKPARPAAKSTAKPTGHARPGELTTSAKPATSAKSVAE
jgi:polyhydroxyalkanoic acid synthase PhaR subunit